MSISADFLEVSLREQKDSTVSYRTLLAPQCANYLISKYETKDFFIIIRLDSDDILLPFYFNTIRRILSLMPSYTAQYPYTLIPTVQQKQTVYTRNCPFDSPTLLEFPLGVQKSLISSKQNLTLWGENNFSSIWVSKEDIKERGIMHFAFPHDRIPSFLKRTQVSTLKPAWVQILHSENEQNNFFAWGKDYCWGDDEQQISNLFN